MIRLGTKRFVSNFSNHLTYFQSILPSHAIHVNPSMTAPHYTRDWTHHYGASSPCVLLPETTDQCHHILSYCYEHNLKMVPQGGNTGLVGGAVTKQSDEIIIGMQRMKRIRAWDAQAGVVVVEAGVTLQALDEFVGKEGWMVPLDLGAKGSCHIGGNLATNAGGLRLIRYGSLHANVVGIEVVLPRGEIYSHLNTLRKDNTGYALHHLFIGSEGTLGVITAVALNCVHRPAFEQVAVLALPNFEAVLKVCEWVRRHLTGLVSAIEYWDDIADQLMEQTARAPRKAVQKNTPFYALIEVHGSDPNADAQRFESAMELMMSSLPDIEDAVISQDATQRHEFWQRRERLAEAFTQKTGHVYKYDVSLVPSAYQGLVEKVRNAIEEKGWKNVIAGGYGHVADGNLHLNISVPDYNDIYQEFFDNLVLQYVQQTKGSISAEHGIGQAKQSWLPKVRNISLMQQIKATLDPKNLMNPGKVL